MNILITRPSPDGEQLVHKLLSMGKLAYHLPLIYFSVGKDLLFLEQQMNVLSAGDFLFIVSRNAILYAHKQLLSVGKSWPNELLYYSIGHSTSALMYNLSGILVKYPTDHETSEGLLNLPELIGINENMRCALVLKGNNGRVILENTLRERGVYVTCCECYSRHFFKYDGVVQCRRMLSLNIKTVVVTSEIILIQLYYLIPEYYRIFWLIQCQLIVVSVRLAIRARQLGWKNIIVTCSAKNKILIQFLIKYT